VGGDGEDVVLDAARVVVVTVVKELPDEPVPPRPRLTPGKGLLICTGSPRGFRSTITLLPFEGCVFCDCVVVGGDAPVLEGEGALLGDDGALFVDDGELVVVTGGGGGEDG